MATALNERLARLRKDDLAARLLAIGDRSASRISPELAQREHVGPANFIDLAGGVGVLQAVHDGVGDVFHPDGLKARIGGCKRNHRKDLLEPGKGVEEFVFSAKNHAGPQHGHIQPGAEQHGFTARLAALVHRCRTGRSAQGADVNDAPEAAGFTGPGQLQRQLHMRLVERGLCAVKDGNQVDHGVVAGQQRCQRGGIVGVGLNHIDQRQHLQVAGAGLPACDHGDAALQPRQLFADVRADKAGAAKKKDFFHNP